jgi:hypothetical protein
VSNNFPIGRAGLVRGLPLCCRCLAAFEQMQPHTITMEPRSFFRLGVFHPHFASICQRLRQEIGFASRTSGFLAAYPLDGIIRRRVEWTN